jgi:hypothetical protein
VLGRWDLAEADQGDANATLGESGREFTGVVPNPAESVSRHQKVHDDSLRSSPLLLTSLSGA